MPKSPLQKVKHMSDMDTAGRQNEVLAAILTRRSIRKYEQDKPISEGDLRAILTAGLCAPSAANRQPVRLIAVRDRAALAALSTAKGEAEMIMRAAMAIVVCGDSTAQSYREFLIEDCAAAVQNMLLAIHSLGLGAVWCGVPSILEDCVEVYRNALALPEHIIPLATIALGVPAETRAPMSRYDESKIHQDRW